MSNSGVEMQTHGISRRNFDIPRVGSFRTHQQPGEQRMKLQEVLFPRAESRHENAAKQTGPIYQSRIDLYM
jgi:hypothetical protein